MKKKKGHNSGEQKDMSKVTRRAALKGVAMLGMASVLPTSGIAASLKRRQRNIIIEENTRKGSQNWQLTRVRPDKSHQRTPWVEGYCNKQSIRAYDTIHIMLSTDPQRYSIIAIFRTAYYDVRGARMLHALAPHPDKVQPVPSPGEQNIHEWKWEKTTSVTIPEDWISGVYL